MGGQINAMEGKFASLLAQSIEKQNAALQEAETRIEQLAGEFTTQNGLLKSVVETKTPAVQRRIDENMEKITDAANQLDAKLIAAQKSVDSFDRLATKLDEATRTNATAIDNFKTGLVASSDLSQCYYDFPQRHYRKALGAAHTSTRSRSFRSRMLPIERASAANGAPV